MLAGKYPGWNYPAGWELCWAELYMTGGALRSNNYATSDRSWTGTYVKKYAGWEVCQLRSMTGGKYASWEVWPVGTMLVGKYDRWELC
jgi:hypothetical protein